MTATPELDLTADELAEEQSLTGHSYAAAREDGSAPMFTGSDRQTLAERLTVGLFVAVPLLAVLLAVPFAWGWGLGWSDVVIGVVMYAVAAHGITIGFHRAFTHGSFKPNRPLKIALAIAGSLAIEGPVARWVADHRKHHAFSDAEGDPHSPWAYGESTRGLIKGFFYAHTGWLFDVEQTPMQRYAPDLLKDKDLVRVSRLFPLWVAVSLLAPAVIGGLVTWSWHGAVTALFWASIVRVGLVHHVTWSINSVCHLWGKHPFKTRDRSGNVAWLALFSGGESWHNMHHSDPTSARHGVLHGQVDTSARMIELFERRGWAQDVRWPRAERLRARMVDPESTRLSRKVR
ncbi:MAG: acyl-CoA desaturase [Frankiales bacterium]|nr:acyl-CoA desaturase [Frankiales bacterium]